MNIIGQVKLRLQLLRESFVSGRVSPMNAAVEVDSMIQDISADQSLPQK